MAPGKASLALRAVLALALLVGFYVVALALAGGLAFIPVAELVYGGRLHHKLALLCWIGAAVVILSALPRRDVFEVPGPRLARARHPRLFALLDDVARAVGATLPEEVYLLPEVDAFVSELRGGLLGLGRRRVLGLGLPLLQVLGANELRAIVAHELGHFHHGDFVFGPWIYRTRAGLDRTKRNLGSGILSSFFRLYRRVFNGITHAITRRVELDADALAARLAGSRALAGALGKIRSSWPAFGDYWHLEVLPVVEAGYRPPIAEGFERFLEAAPVREAIARTLAAPERHDPEATHPPLAERIAAIEALARPGELPAVPDVRAIALLDEPVEVELLGQIVGTRAHRLAPIAWEDVPARVLVPTWEQVVSDERAFLEGVTRENLRERAPEIARGLERRGDADPVVGAAAVVGAFLGLALVKEGFQVRSGPGQRIRLERGETSLELVTLAGRLVRGEVPPGETF